MPLWQHHLVPQREQSMLTRRQALGAFANGFGMLGLASLFGAETFAGESVLAVKQPHYPAKAKRVIFLFMSGGPSHVDTFDPKPALGAHNGIDAGQRDGTPAARGARPPMRPA